MLLVLKKTLQDVIDIAQAVCDNTASTQTEVDNSVTALTAAMTAYEGQEITPVAPDALFGHWTFDEGTGTTTADQSGNGYNGTFGNEPMFGFTTVPAWTADRHGVAAKAITFNEGAKITVTYNTALNPTQMTIALWVKADVIDANNRFLGLHSWHGYKFQLQSDNKPFFTAATDEGTGTIYDKDAGVGIGVSQWYHLAVTFGGGEMVFYINGVKMVTWDDTPGDLVTVTDHDLVFGVGSSKYAATDVNYGTDHIIPIAWGGYFQGSLDEIRMYNTVLTASQILTLYSTEKPE